MLPKVYINGIGCISAQNTIDDNWFFETTTPVNGDFFNAIEPSYKEYIAPNLLRRMGRAIKMGVASASLAIKEAEATKIDAIVTGTGLGCFEDSERFLLALIENEEQFLTPTSFIQSTHNTVGSQIALIMKCHDYNFTYVHRGFSFESALQDALMLFAEGKETILIGGIEEHTPTYVDLNRRANKFKSTHNASVPIHQSTTDGIQMGEGSAFFVLTKHKTEKSLAAIYSIKTLYKPKTSEEILDKLNLFLKEYHLTLADIDATLMGFCGDVNFDALLKGIYSYIQTTTSVCTFKNLSGEYHTASAFATWLATKMIQKQTIPQSSCASQTLPKKISYVLIINQYLGINYSFTLLGKS